LAPSRTGAFLTQLLLATLPLLGVLLYFLYRASRRPYENVYDDDEVLLSLTDIVITFGVTFVLWSMLLAYLVIYVPKRRGLIEQYEIRGHAVVGDVQYIGKARAVRNLLCCSNFGKGDIAVLTYSHPDQNRANEEAGTVYAEEGPARRRHWTIRRPCRTYHPYSREKVPLVLLPRMPRSAVPKSDLEVEMAVFRRRDEEGDSTALVVRIAVVPWMVFTLLGGWYVVHIMGKVDDPYDPYKRGMIIHNVLTLIVAPVLALGGNHFRWLQYKRYLTDSGKIVESQLVERFPTPEEEEAAVNEVEEGGTCMDEVCGAPSDADLGINGMSGGGNSPRRARTPYSRMT